MMDTNDILSFFVGALIFCLGLFPILKMVGVGPSFFALNFLSVEIIAWILAVASLYLVFDSIQELTNSSDMGWISIIVAFVILALGLMQLLGSFNIGPGLFGFTLPMIVYYIIFLIEGAFLFIAGFAMDI